MVEDGGLSRISGIHNVITPGACGPLNHLRPASVPTRSRITLLDLLCGLLPEGEINHWTTREGPEIPACRHPNLKGSSGQSSFCSLYFVKTYGWFASVLSSKTSQEDSIHLLNLLRDTRSLGKNCHLLKLRFSI